jgi:glycosyltransferase involved in cell wall biosynthesis
VFEVKTGVIIDMVDMHDKKSVNHLNDVLQIISDAVKIYPDSCNLTEALAELLAESERYNEALGICEKFLARFNADEKVLSLMTELRKRSCHKGRPVINENSLSLCMIVKNEEKQLARCLASLRPVVDDIVIVDTGSNDRTVDIATAFGARVFDFSWNGDFSAARNYSLSKASGTWILVMDADEAFAEQDFPILQRLLNNSSNRQVAWNIITRNYTNRVQSEGWQANDGRYPLQEQGDGWYPSKKVRLFSAYGKIRFHGDIHEMVEEDLRKNGIPILQADFVVHHYGELAETDRRDKQLRYYEMGKQKLALRPDDTTSITELAIQAGELELYREALELWDLLIARGEITRDVYFNRSYVLMGLKCFNEASEMACKALEIDPAHTESAYNYGICLLNLAKPEQAVEVIEPFCARHPEHPLLMALHCVLSLCLNAGEEASHSYNELIARNYAISGYVLERIAALESMGFLALADGLKKTAAEQKIIAGS